MSDQRAVDLVLRARNEVSEGAEEAASSLDQLAQEAQQLDSEFRQLEEAGAAGEQFDQLRDSVSRLNEELSSAQGIQQSIDNFRRLKTETVDAEQAWQSATANVRELAQEIAATEEPSRSLVRSFERAKKSAANSKDAYEQKQQALHSLRTELTGSGVDTRNLQDAQQQLASRTEEMAGELNAAKTEIGEIGQEATQAGAGFSDMQKAIGLAAGALAALGAKQQMGSIIDEQELLQRNLLRTQALIEASGRAGEVSAKQMHEQARQLALATLESTEGVMEAQQILLGYQNIGTETFDRITERAADYAAVMQTNLVGATRQLARAFDDPAGSIDALSRVFTAEQREMIRAMQETNGVAAAQEEMLRLLEDRVGGVSRAQAERLAGAQDTLAQAIQEARIATADYLQVGERLEGFYSRVAEEVFVFNDALRAGEYDTAIAAIQGIATALGVMTAAYLAATRGAAALTAAKGALAASTAAATRTMVAFNSVVRANPVGLIATAIAAASAGFAVFKGSANDAGESLNDLAEAAELLNKSVSELSDAEVDAALLNMSAAAKETFNSIIDLELEIDRLEAKRTAAAEAGEELSIREQRRLANARVELERENDLRDQQLARIRQLEGEQQKITEGIRGQAEAARDLADATDEAAESQRRAKEEAEVWLSELGTSFDELETGITASEQKTLDYFQKVVQSGQLTAQQMESLGDRVARSLRSEASIAALRELGEVGAEAVERAAQAADESARKASEQVSGLSGQVRQFLSEAQQANIDLSEAIQTAKTREELEAVEQAVTNLMREQNRAFATGQRTGMEEVRTLDLRRQARERMAEIENQSAQSVDRETRSLQEQRREVQGLATDINQLPERIETNIALNIETTPQQLQQQIAQLANQLNAEVPVKLVVDQSELNQLTQTIQQAARRIGASVASEIIKELRKRG
ncbi:hypothetical protein SAMN05660443_0260 [Marinospirillum celere]|uniref:Prophage tail length tape measure protein n=1 Tax=Marinospirillum celere TaxID=1122252 RepID=A0A1I1E7F6_9GAMM|nr:hypothetical protein [Marinospirillum celere]SFB80893.1 hypothetical protein SAMN05660443_0260 [Marinospirillum celere]